MRVNTEIIQDLSYEQRQINTEQSRLQASAEIEKQQLQQKQYYDKKRVVPHKFKVGDKVLLKNSQVVTMEKVENYYLNIVVLIP